MTKTPEGCGVRQHPSTCLCDVVVKEPTQFTVFVPDQLKHGDFIAKQVDFTRPMTTEKFATFLDEYMRGWQAIWRMREIDLLAAMGTIDYDPVADTVRVKRSKGTMNSDQFEFAKRMIEQGYSYGEISKMLKKAFDININKTTIAKIKYRMVRWEHNEGRDYR